MICGRQLTASQRIPRWFLPIEGDLKLGGKYQLKGNAGGTITACTPPRQFAATWEFGGGTTWIEVKVAAERGKARLTLEHTAIIEDHWNQFGPGAVGIGWDLAVVGLGATPGDRRAGGPCDGRGVDGITKRQGVHEPERRVLARGSCRERSGSGFGQGAVGPDHRFLSRRDPAGCGAPGHRKLMHVFEVLSDPVRRRILELLGRGEMASGEVVEAIGAEFGITQAAVSQHLKVLRESGFAQVRADAQRRLYSVDAAGLQAVDEWVGQFRGFWEPKLDALATEIARGKRERRKAPMTKRTGKRA